MEKLELWSGRAPSGEGKTEETSVCFTVYRPEKPNGKAVIICPGGGYRMLMTEPEGVGIATWLTQNNITGIVLEYRLPKGDPYRPLYDAQRAIRTVRANARNWGCDPNQIGIMGFSAGGHLASAAATHFDFENPNAADPIEQISCRPDFAILIYPVITMEPEKNSTTKSREVLLGKNPAPELVELFSSEKQVSNQTPPVYLAHAANDHVVSPRHSQLFHDALLAHGVETEYLKLPSGDHGLNQYQGPMWEAWKTQSLEWLETLDVIPKN